MTRTSNPCAVVLAFAAIAASGTAMAANTITFSGEVTDQTCQVAVNGFTDTYLLGKNETARVALVADNPGLWMFHCHVIDHMETGLMGTIAVGEAWCG